MLDLRLLPLTLRSFAQGQRQVQLLIAAQNGQGNRIAWGLIVDQVTQQVVEDFNLVAVHSNNEIANAKLLPAGISSAYIDAAARSGIAVCKRRSELLSECQPLISIPAIPIRAGIISRVVTPRSENPERRFTKAGIQ